MRFLATWKKQAKNLEAEIYAVYLASSPRVPWYAKAFLALIIGYALSPIDLIPDFIPVLGYLDDLVIVPGGIFLAIKMIPHGVMAECRAKAKNEPVVGKAKWIAAAFIILIWLALIFLLFKIVWRMFK